MNLSFPTQVNIKCIVLTAASFLVYCLSTAYNSNLKAATIVSASLVPISSLVVWLYQKKWYKCKRIGSVQSWLASIAFVLLMSTIPFLALVMRNVVLKVPNSKWRKRQILQAVRYVAVPFAIGVLLYILMNRFDALLDCTMRMKPTAISAATAIFKTKGYRKHLQEPNHLARFAFWSSILYAAIISITFGVAGGIRFRNPRS